MREDIADYLCISVSTVDQLRSTDRMFPAPVMIGTLPRWSPAAVVAWFEGAEPQTAVEPTPLPRPVQAKPARRGGPRAAAA